MIDVYYTGQSLHLGSRFVVGNSQFLLGRSDFGISGGSEQEASSLLDYETQLEFSVSEEYYQFVLNYSISFYSESELHFC